MEAIPKIILLLFGGIWFLLILNCSLTTIIRSIFWITFLNMFFSHIYFQQNVFDLSGAGYATRMNWLADILIFVFLFRLLCLKEYRKHFFSINFFFLIFAIIIVSALLHYQSLFQMILSLRMMYIFPLLIYVINIYNFENKTYERFFKLFFILAIINSIMSIIQFPMYGWTGDQSGGIFGFHNTGVSAIFAITQASLCFQIFINKREKKYLFYAFFISIPIVTGQAYFGYILILFILVFIYFQHIKAINPAKFIIASGIIVCCLVVLTKQILAERDINTYLEIFTNWDRFRETTIKDPYRGDGFGRLGSVIFGVEQMTEDMPSFLIGHGPGSISYIGYTTGIRNEILDYYGVKSVDLPLVYIYELGIAGPFFFIMIFFILFRRWKKTKVAHFERLPDYYFKNIPVILAIYFIGTFYTATFSNYFLVIFFAFNLSYLNHLNKKPEEAINSNNLVDIRSHRSPVVIPSM